VVAAVEEEVAAAVEEVAVEEVTAVNIYPLL